MKNLAPNILRQRILIEGFYGINVDDDVIRNYFKGITESLGLRTYGEPTVYATGGVGKETNQGYDAFVPLVDSGISVYVWTNEKFFSVTIYTCKSFNEEKAIATTREFFRSEKMEFLSF